MRRYLGVGWRTRWVVNSFLLKRRRIAAHRTLETFSRPYRLHVGCGSVRLDGWVNLDVDTRLDTADVVWNLVDGLPCDAGSCRFVYSEHVLEHLPVEDGVQFLRECRRVLEPKGVVRIAMPSLDVLIEKSSNGNWRDQDWLTWPEYQFIQTRAEMLNIAFRWWDHKWLYDREELHRRLREAGFETISDVELGQSEHSELQNRESRKDSLLICEATK